MLFFGDLVIIGIQGRSLPSYTSFLASKVDWLVVRKPEFPLALALEKCHTDEKVHLREPRLKIPPVRTQDNSFYALWWILHIILLVPKEAGVHHGDLGTFASITMNASSKSSELTSNLESLLTMLAKECLINQPEDMECFCLELLAKRREMQLSPIVKLSRGLSLALDEDLLAVEDDIGAAQLSSTPAPQMVKPSQRAYHSSDESEEDVRRVSSYHSNGSQFDVAEEFTAIDMEGTSRVKTAKALQESDVHDLEDHNSCYLFSTEVISPEELQAKTRKYVTDERMKSLFRAWDGDDSGAVNFVELVLALHKFEQVAHAGIDIQVASDALLQFVESDTERELKLQEFARVIILFALNNFKKDFEEVADHMLEVANCTSEAAVLHAKTGRDTSEIEAADKEETEFLRETVKCMEEQVTDNIVRIRTKRVAFRQGSSTPHKGNGAFKQESSTPHNGNSAFKAN